MESPQRTHIIIPSDLLQEIDALVGPRGRSAFLLETARQEVRRRKLLRFLEADDPAWKADAHPELAQGSGAWVRKLREQSDFRGGSARQSPRSQSQKSKPRHSK
jgi:hypothetical protein